MSKLEAAFDLPVDADRTFAACRHVLAELDWSVLEQTEDHLVAREDPTRLPCCAAPARVEVSIAGRGDGLSGSRVTMATRVPGFGPISARQVKDRSAGLQSRIRRRAAG